MSAVDPSDDTVAAQAQKALQERLASLPPTFGAGRMERAHSNAAQVAAQPPLTAASTDMICMINFSTFECLCCQDGSRPAGGSFLNVLHHLGSKQHSVHLQARARLHRRRVLLQAWRFAARLIGLRLRAAERLYAPEGRGYEQARQEFKAIARV